MQEILRTYTSTIAPDNDHPFLQGPFTPTMEEWIADTDSMQVIGEIPKDLHGIYVRNTHNQVHESLGMYHPSDGDGMLHSMHCSRARPATSCTSPTATKTATRWSWTAASCPTLTSPTSAS